MQISVERYETADTRKLYGRVWTTKVTINGKSVRYTGKLSRERAIARALDAWTRYPQIFR